MKKLISILMALSVALPCAAAPMEDLLQEYYGYPSQTPAEYTDLGDVPWAREAIDALSKYRVIPPAEDGLFHPNDPIMREEFVEYLISALGLYDQGATSEFTDCQPTDRHYPYISTAKKLGITQGLSETEFGVGKSLTRQEMVTLVCRAAAAAGIPLSQSEDVSQFIDAADISPYARSSVGSLAAEGIVSGTPEHAFLPLKNTSRAEACKIIYFIVEKNT